MSDSKRDAVDRRSARLAEVITEGEAKQLERETGVRVRPGNSEDARRAVAEIARRSERRDQENR